MQCCIVASWKGEGEGRGEWEGGEGRGEWEGGEGGVGGRGGGGRGGYSGREGEGEGEGRGEWEGEEGRMKDHTPSHHLQCSHAPHRSTADMPHIQGAAVHV